MDITQFINSRDIRDYLKEIGYEFSSLEGAWLIGNCMGITLEKRHAAWRELIRAMPDMKIEKRLNTRAWPSLHDYLEKRMTYESRLNEAFLTKEEGAVYSCAVWLSNRVDDYGLEDYGDDLNSFNGILSNGSLSICKLLPCNFPRIILDSNDMHC